MVKNLLLGFWYLDGLLRRTWFYPRIHPRMVPQVWRRFSPRVRSPEGITNYDRMPRLGNELVDTSVATNAYWGSLGRVCRELGDSFAYHTFDSFCTAVLARIGAVLQNYVRSLGADGPRVV